jgi:hypothetical protein
MEENDAGRRTADVDNTERLEAVGSYFLQLGPAVPQVGDSVQFGRTPACGTSS